MLNDTVEGAGTSEVSCGTSAGLNLEQTFQLFAEMLPQLIWISSADGMLTYANGPWRRYCALPRLEKGIAWRSIVHPEDLAHVNHAVACAMAAGESVETEARLRNGSSGEYRWFVCQAQPVRNEAGATGSWIWTCTDIHRSKSASETLRRAKDELETIGHARDEFVSAISHELRTPLNAILGWTQLLQMNMLELDEARQAINSIEQNARAQAQLVEDMLDVTRAANNKLRINAHLIDAREPIYAAIETIRPMADREQVQLRADLPDSPVWINADEGRLQQIVWNLLSNGVKFSEKQGTVRLTLKVAAEHAHIIVSDSGRGIAPELLQRLFGRFVQADSSSTQKQLGLGLGLSIVKHLVELHGGSVQAESPGLGLGATFTVALPLQTISEGPVKPSGPAPTLLPGALENVKVLVVDDEAFARQLVATTLRKAGAEPCTASSVAEAYQVLAEFVPQVVVCDIGMPGEDGYEFVTRLRGLPDRVLASTPAIALTGYASIDDRMRALAAGFDQHVAKPVSSAELVRTVAAVAHLARP